MNICFAIGNLSYSGAEKILLNLILELNKRKHSISVILLSCNKKIDNLPSTVKQYPIFDLEDEKIENKFVRVKKRKKRIKKVIDNNKFDLLISFGVKFNLDIVEACKNKNLKIVLCERNDPVFDPKSKLLRFRRQLSYKNASAYVFQTKEIRDFFKKSIRNRSVIIPNFIEKHNNNEYINSQHRNAFVTCARLDDNQKSQVFMIKTFAKFVKNYTDYKLEFIGDGPDKDKYIELVKELKISDKVVFHGNERNPLQVLPKCKCFILTSKYEGMPNALIEAMSIGMPCISTDCSGGGAKYLINNKKNGILIDCNSEEQLLSAMMKVANNKIDLFKMSKEAHKINDKLDMKKIVDDWEKFIINIIKNEKEINI